MRRLHLPAALAAAAILASCGHSLPAPSSPTPAVGRVAAHGYTTVGNAIFDSTGARRVFHGLNRPSLEWRSDGEQFSPADFALIHDVWKSDLVRIPLNQDFWLKGAAQYDSTYAATVDRVVHQALAAGLHVLLDLHWNDRGDLQVRKSGQQRMPDVNSIEFWKQVAARYKGETHVFFDLYNEPHDVTWKQWHDGGMLDVGIVGDERKRDEPFVAAGMQQLYDAVRSTGARNLVFVGGLDWGYDMTGVPAHPIRGYNIVYSTHPYVWKHSWREKAFFLAATEPLFMGEFGTGDCSTHSYTEAIALADSLQLSWAAWAWYGHAEDICKWPTVIKDWSGTPTVMGDVVKAALARYLPSGLLPGEGKAAERAAPSSPGR